MIAPLDVLHGAHADHRAQIATRAIDYLASAPRVKRTIDIAREVSPTAAPYVSRLLGYAFQVEARKADSLVVQWSGRERGHASLWAHRDWMPTLEATRPRRLAA